MASVDTLTAVHNLAVWLQGDPPEHLGWLSGLGDRFPRLRTLGVALQGPAEWYVERRSTAEAQAALRALPAALTRLEMDIPALSPSRRALQVASSSSHSTWALGGDCK